VVLLLGQIVAAAVHVVPSLVYAPRQLRSTTRVVAYLADLGPAWVFAFGMTSVLLAGALWWKRGEWLAHLWCGAVWVMYCVGLWIGALGDSPRGTVLFPIVATIIVAMHVILAASYNEDAVYLEELRR
jgi:hypothetical protein